LSPDPIGIVPKGYLV